MVLDVDSADHGDPRVSQRHGAPLTRLHGNAECAPSYPEKWRSVSSATSRGSGRPLDDARTVSTRTARCRCGAVADTERFTLDSCGDG
ncbi:hypothetical protein NHX12_026298 [Muraenolepis orangiensis]|uniref:Uncharacterized protein n=1 Tax=Muraenolepis orangiensis TaxID=630683 RepID=A0A9Q0EH39_9TELE|nr:hypothetical protein NHX12_026298 [Muraenolepis orangiensis]